VNQGEPLAQAMQELWEECQRPEVRVRVMVRVKVRVQRYVHRRRLGPTLNLTLTLIGGTCIE